MTIDYTLHIILWLFHTTTTPENQTWSRDMGNTAITLEKTTDGLLMSGPPESKMKPEKIIITEKTVSGIMYPDDVDVYKELSLSDTTPLKNVASLLCSAEKKVSCFQSITLSEKVRSFSYVHPKKPEMEMKYEFNRK